MYYIHPHFLKGSMSTLGPIILLTRPMDPVAVESKKLEDAKRRPFQVAFILYKRVAIQVSFSGPTDALADSTVITEVAGIVIQYPEIKGGF